MRYYPRSRYSTIKLPSDQAGSGGTVAAWVCGGHVVGGVGDDGRSWWALPPSAHQMASDRTACAPQSAEQQGARHVVALRYAN
jgi:hypothetical protein